MLQLSFIRENKDTVLKRLKQRGFKQLDLIDVLISEDEKRRKNQQLLEDLNAKRNKLSKEIGQLYGQGKREEAEKLKGETGNLKSDIEKFESELGENKQKVFDILVQIPNIPHESVPVGNSDEDNEVHKDWSGDFPNLAEDALPHWELAKKYDLIDFELGAKITGSGFPLYKGKGSKLQRALVSFFLDEAEKGGYLEILPPFLVNEESAFGTGQLPDKEGQMYYANADDLYLIPTAEVPITNIYRNVIVSEADLPIKLTGYTPCFRREAGSYGAHVRGLNRVHQFDKVEIVQIQHPDKSYESLDQMVIHIENLLHKLELPYRILRLCGGDLGFTSNLTFDFEVFSAAQKRWLEVSSVSNFLSFQANRLKLRFKDQNGKTQLAHTLNGSALALARIYASILENNQTEEGIVIPEVLRPYTGFAKID